MATVRELTGSYTSVLVGVPVVQDGVCHVCHSAAGPGFTTCFKCSDAVASLGAARCADVVVPVSLSIKGEQWAADLARYKNVQIPGRGLIAARVAAVLWRFLEAHEGCVATAAGCAAFDVVTTVPSQTGRTGQHPLEDLVGRVVPLTRDRHASLLVSAAGATTERTYPADRFACGQDLAGRSVLLIDDQWTTGSRVQPAAAALKAAGGVRVGVVVLGRHVDPASTRAGNAEYVAAHGRAPFRWETCAAHPKRAALPGSDGPD